MSSGTPSVTDTITALAEPCERCGSFGADTRRGEPPNERFCDVCDAKLGVVPWERERGWLRRWWRTVAAVVGEPTETMARLPPEGPVAPTFVLANLVVHLSGQWAWFAFVGWWQYRLSVERFGLRDGVGRIVALDELVDSVAFVPVAALVVTLTTPALVRATARLLGGRVSGRHALRASVFPSAFLCVAAIPFGAIVAPLLAARALSRVRGVPANRATLAAVLVVIAWMVAIILARAFYEAVLAEPVFELAVRLRRGA